MTATGGHRRPLDALFRCGMLLVAVFIAACRGSAPTPEPIVSASVSAADDVVARFVVVSQAPDRTMHMVWQGTYADQDGVHPFTGAYDFAGEDFAGEQELTTAPSAASPDGRITIELARVGGRGFTSFHVVGSGLEPTWHEQTSMSTMDPLRGLTQPDVDYVEMQPGAVPGQHHLRVQNYAVVGGGLVAAFGTAPSPADEPPSSESSLDVWVGDDGVPSAASLVMVDSAALGQISRLEAEIRFSGWGEELTIVAPIP